MSWVSVLKWGKGARRTFDDFKRAKSLAFSWSFTLPHVVREKEGRFTVMMKNDTYGFPENEYGPIVWETKGRR